MGVRGGRNRLLGRVGGPSARNWIEQRTPRDPLNERAKSSRLRFLKPRPLAKNPSPPPTPPPALSCAFHVELDDLIQDFSPGFNSERVTQGALPCPCQVFTTARQDDIHTALLGLWISTDHPADTYTDSLTLRIPCWFLFYLKQDENLLKITFTVFRRLKYLFYCYSRYISVLFTLTRLAFLIYSRKVTIPRETTHKQTVFSLHRTWKHKKKAICVQPALRGNHACGGPVHG